MPPCDTEKNFRSVILANLAKKCKSVIFVPVGFAVQQTIPTHRPRHHTGFEEMATAMKVISVAPATGRVASLRARKASVKTVRTVRVSASVEIAHAAQVRSVRSGGPTQGAL